MQHPIFILVKPQMGENIGLCARAMRNYQLMDLRLVNPRDGWPNPKAYDASADGMDLMNPIKVYDSTADALADCHLVFATTRRPRGMDMPVTTPEQAGKEMAQAISSGLKTAIIFGGESSGLSNYDVSMAHKIIQLPSCPDFSSLNLSHAVAILSYQYHCCIATPPSPEASPKVRPHLQDQGASSMASQAEFNRFMDVLSAAMDDGHFFKTADMRDIVIRNTRNLFQRMQPSSNELHSLYGIFKNISRSGAFNKKK